MIKKNKISNPRKLTLLAAILILNITIISVSCEKIADNVILPDFDEKLVVECFLNPDDSVTYVKVATNKNIFGKLMDYQPTGTLAGTISDGVTEINLSVWNKGLYFNHNDLPIEQGKSYTLKVGSSKGYSITAICTVPVRGNYLLEADTSNYTNVYEYSYEYYYNGSYYNDYYFYEEHYVRINLFLTDNSGVQNYYSTSIKHVTYDTTYFGKEPYVSTSISGNNFFSDETKGVKTLLLSNDIYLDFSPSIDSSIVTFYLMATDKEYHIYTNSFENYNEGEVFTEVSPLYSNIEGGLGIFSAYLIADSIRVRIK